MMPISLYPDFFYLASLYPQKRVIEEEPYVKEKREVKEKDLNSPTQFDWQPLAKYQEEIIKREDLYNGNVKITFSNGDWWEGTDQSELWSNGKGKRTTNSTALCEVWSGKCRMTFNLENTQLIVEEYIYIWGGQRDCESKILNVQAIIEGEFKDGKLNGPGKELDFVGNLSIGEFKEGKLNGQGKKIDLNGSFFGGKFKNGELIQGLSYEVYVSEKSSGKAKWIIRELNDGDLISRFTYRANYSNDGNRYSNLLKSEFIKVWRVPLKDWCSVKNGLAYMSSFQGFELICPIDPPNGLSTTTDALDDATIYQQKNFAILTNEGKVKTVWENKKKYSSVYYTPKGLFLTTLEKLEKEFIIMEEIKSDCKNGFKHLAVDGKKLPEHYWINDTFTIEVERASRDLNKALLDKSTTLLDRIQFGYHLLKGLAELHDAGYSHGDLKPQNCLIYRIRGQTILKISDFEKAVKHHPYDDSSKLLFTGNRRYGPPEDFQSCLGDMYAAGLILMRIFEEVYLLKIPLLKKSPQKDSLITCEKEERKTVATEDCRGIEKYIVEHKDFLSNNSGTLNRVLEDCRYSLSLETETERYKKQFKALNRYTQKLEINLIREPHLLVIQARRFCKLLEKMTHPNPKERLSSAKIALTQYYEAFFFNIKDSI